MPNIFIISTVSTPILEYIKLPIKGLNVTVLSKVKRLQQFQVVLLLRNLGFTHTRMLDQ